MSARQPRVSVIMPVINEERHLRHAVDGILAQDYGGELEVVISVGPSKDRTREIADLIASEHPSVLVVDNPCGKTPSGLNAAISRSTGEVVVRVDGHAMIPGDYVRMGVEVLDETGADGLIPIRSLGREFFNYDESTQTLTGSDTGVKLGMGQRVVVRLMEAVPVTGGLTLELLSLDGAALPTASGRGGKRGGFQPRQPSKAAAKDRALKRKVIRKRK